MLAKYCAFVIFFISAYRCQDNSVVFVHHPKSPGDLLMHGRPANLTCETNVPANVFWTLNGSPLASTPRRSWSSSPRVHTLHVSRLERYQDVGTFACSASSLFHPETEVQGRVQSEGAALKITWLDTPTVELVSPDNSSDIVKGKDVTLECEADVGEGEMQYHWFKNAERIYGKNQRLELKKNKLHIKQVSARDNGVYRCSVHYQNESRESRTNFILAIKENNLPQMVLCPEDVTAALGKTAILDCQFKMADSIEWYKNDLDSPVENGGRYTVHKNGSLAIKNITKREEAFYTCVAHRKNAKNQYQKYSAKLTVASLSLISRRQFEPILGEDHVVYGMLDKPFTINCLPSRDSFPVPLVMWKGPQSHLISDAGLVRVLDGSLVIDSLQRQHQGSYSCLQENMAGVQETSIFLLVADPPKITASPSNVLVDEGGNATFECQVTINKQEQLYFQLKDFWSKLKVSGKPHSPLHSHPVDHAGEREFPMNLVTTPAEEETSAGDSKAEQWMNDFNLDLYHVVWRKDMGKTMKPEHGHVTIDPRLPKLVISNAVPSDKGQYWCEVVSPAWPSLNSNPATLVLTEKLKFFPPPVSKRLELSSSARIHCKVQGTPIPTVTWHKNKDGPLPEEVHSINGTLQFNRVSRSHKGNYTCRAESSQGTITTTIHLDVVVSPRFLSPLPMQIVDAVEGSSVWLDCIAEGEPPPRVQWDRNLATLQQENTRFHVFPNGTLHISSTKQEDSDHYGCTAGNSAGLKREELILVVHVGGFADGIAESEEGVISRPILITMSIVGGYILLVVGLMVWCRMRKRNKLTHCQDTEKLENGDVELKDADAVTDRLIQEAPASASLRLQRDSSVNPQHSDQSELSAASRRSKGDRSVPKDSLTDYLQIGRGEFGDVFTARCSHPSVIQACGGADAAAVLVLAVSLSTRDHSLLQEVRRRMDLLAKVQHAHVARGLGVCKEQEPHRMLLEHTDWGDLKQFLLSTRTAEEAAAHREITGEADSTPHSTEHYLMQPARLRLVQQLAAAMQTISNARLTHRDLAARNCLITSQYNLKVSYPSLTKDVYSKEYCKHQNQVIPLRWLPQECVYDDDHSTKSDVYMFACTVWEIFHKGELPFIKMSDSTVLTHMKNNTLKWKHHPDMPQKLAQLLDLCWESCPSKRPSFNDVAEQASQILNESSQSTAM